MPQIITDLVYAGQMGNVESIQKLLDKFTPLLRNLTTIIAEISHLDAEDIYTDLQIEFILLIKRINLSSLSDTEDKILTSYIATSMRRIKNNYINSYRHRIITVSFESLSIQDLCKIECDHGTYGSYGNLILSDLKKYLTSNESYIIKKIYFEHNRPSDIATQLKISRQAVNQTKNRALRKLRKAFS